MPFAVLPNRRIEGEENRFGSHLIGEEVVHRVCKSLYLIPWLYKKRCIQEEQQADQYD